MHQKDLARHAWTKAGLRKSRDPRFGEFFLAFETSVDDCWPELASLVRDSYPDLMEQLVVPLWKTRDPLLRMNLIRYLNPSLRNERNLLQTLMALTDSRGDRLELLELGRLGDRGILDALARRRTMSGELRDVIRIHRERILP